LLTGSSLEYLGNCLELQGMAVEHASSAKIFTQLFTTFHTSFLPTLLLFSFSSSYFQLCKPVKTGMIVTGNGFVGNVVVAELTGNDNSSFRLTLTLDLEEDNYMTVGLHLIIALLH
jgi:hypothetical protein